MSASLLKGRHRRARRDPNRAEGYDVPLRSYAAIWAGVRVPPGSHYEPLVESARAWCATKRIKIKVPT